MSENTRIPVHNTCSASPTQLKESGLSEYEPRYDESSVENMIKEDAAESQLSSDSLRFLRVVTSNRNNANRSNGQDEPKFILKVLTSLYNIF